MPTYQYACTECGHQLEAVQSFTDSPLTECPACTGRLRKLFSSVGIVFKGSGFYRNDSRAGSANGDSPAKTETKKESVGTASGDSSASGSGTGKSGSDSGGAAKNGSSAGSSTSSSSTPAAAAA